MSIFQLTFRQAILDFKFTSISKFFLRNYQFTRSPIFNEVAKYTALAKILSNIKMQPIMTDEQLHQNTVKGTI